MLYVISELTPPGRVLAGVEAPDALTALSVFGAGKGYARLDGMTAEERDGLGYREMHAGRFAAVSFENFEVLAGPAGEELN